MSMDVRKVKLDFNRTYQNDIPSVQGDTGRSIEFQILVLLELLGVSFTIVMVTQLVVYGYVPYVT